MGDELKWLLKGRGEHINFLEFWVVVCRVGEHQHRWHIDVHYVKISHIHKMYNGIREWGIYGLNRWGICGLNG